MVGIVDAVGRGGVNERQDVIEIQTALNFAAPFKLPLVVDGLCGPLTEGRIRFVQDSIGVPTDQPAIVTDCCPILAHLDRLWISPEWRGNAAAWDQEKKFVSLVDGFQSPVMMLLMRLSEQGFQPSIFYGWRSLIKQAKIYKAGRSHVTFSFHNIQDVDGTPQSHAVDIVDKRWNWNPIAKHNGFWEALGRAAGLQGLEWGGNWRRPDLAHVQMLPNSELRKFAGLAGF